MSRQRDFKSMLPIGTVLRGTYTITQYLASGGFGNTYKATNAFDEDVAIKEFFMRDAMARNDNSTQAHITDSSKAETVVEQMRKFKKEALRLRLFDNPHIVKVHDYFEENDTAYYVMDFIDGETLSERLDRQGRPFTEAEVREILPSIFDALDDVHKSGFFHLDIKPSNIMIDKGGNVFLIDFGASKQIKADESGATTGTQVSFTPDYAPAEILESRMDKVGPWTDIYSLGATLYKLLTGEKPPRQTDIVEGGASVFHFPENVSGEMRNAIIKMMSIRRADRPQSIDDLRLLLNIGGKNSASKDEEKEVTVMQGVSEVPVTADDDVTVISGNNPADVDYQEDATPASEPVYDETPEISGWLKLFLYVIGVTCLACIISLIADLASDEYNGMEALRVADVLQCGLLIAMGIVSINAFVKIKPNAVFYGRAFLVICALNNIIAVFIDPTAKDVGRTVGALIWCVIWFLFLQQSSLVEEIYPPETRKAQPKDWAFAAISFILPWTIVLIWVLNLAKASNTSDNSYGSNASNTEYVDDSDSTAVPGIDPSTLAPGELTDGNIAFTIPSRYHSEKQYTDSLQTEWLYTFNNGKAQSVYGLVVSDYYNSWTNQQFPEIWNTWWDEGLKGLKSKTVYEGEYTVNGNQCYERRVRYQGRVRVFFDLTTVYNEQRQILCVVRTEYVDGQHNPMKDVVNSIRFE